MPGETILTILLLKYECLLEGQCNIIPGNQLVVRARIYIKAMDGRLKSFRAFCI